MILCPPLVRGTPAEEWRFCDLDETAWQFLPAKTLARLAQDVVARAAAAASHPQILQCAVPHVPAGLCLEDLLLETRTRNCLTRQGFARHLEELSGLSVGDLLAINAFGAKCLVDLLTVLETLAAHEGMLDHHLTAEARALAALPGAAEVHRSDPRLGPLLAQIDNRCSTAGELAGRVLQRRLDPLNPSQWCAGIHRLRSRIEELSRLPLEEELGEIFAPSRSPRDRKIVAAYYGWQDGQGRTLEALGQHYGISRERVRQNLRGCGKPPPRSDRVRPRPGPQSDADCPTEPPGVGRDPKGL